MKLESRLLISIRKRPGNVIFRREVANLGSESQLSEALKRLLAEGKLVRLGAGVYVKAHRASNGTVQPDASHEALEREVFQRLGVRVRVIEVGREGNAPLLMLDASSHRITRKLQRRGSALTFSEQSTKPRGVDFDISQDVSHLPKAGVRQFIERLARAYGVEHKRSGLDAFAEAITRMAGDESMLDETGKLLVELKKRDIINNQQLARLVTNYMAEDADVRSVRGLRSPRVPT
jgi:hypothetical protein